MHAYKGMIGSGHASSELRKYGVLDVGHLDTVAAAHAADGPSSQSSMGPKGAELESSSHVQGNLPRCFNGKRKAVVHADQVAKKVKRNHVGNVRLVSSLEPSFCRTNESSHGETDNSSFGKTDEFPQVLNSCVYLPKEVQIGEVAEPHRGSSHRCSFYLMGKMCTDKENLTAERYFKEESPSAEMYSKEESPSAEMYLKEESPSAEMYSTEESPSAEMYSKEESPSAEMYQKEKSPSAEMYSKEESPSAEMYSKEESPSAEMYSKEKSPSAEMYSKEESPSAEMYSKEESRSAEMNPKEESPIVRICPLRKSPVHKIDFKEENITVEGCPHSSSCDASKSNDAKTRLDASVGTWPALNAGVSEDARTGRCRPDTAKFYDVFFCGSDDREENLPWNDDTVDPLSGPLLGEIHNTDDTSLVVGADASDCQSEEICGSFAGCVDVGCGLEAKADRSCSSPDVKGAHVKVHLPSATKGSLFPVVTKEAVISLARIQPSISLAGKQPSSSLAEKQPLVSMARKEPLIPSDIEQPPISPTVQRKALVMAACSKKTAPSASKFPFQNSTVFHPPSEPLPPCSDTPSSLGAPTPQISSLSGCSSVAPVTDHDSVDCGTMTNPSSATHTSAGKVNGSRCSAADVPQLVHGLEQGCVRTSAKRSRQLVERKNSSVLEASTGSGPTPPLLHHLESCVENPEPKTKYSVWELFLMQGSVHGEITKTSLAKFHELFVCSLRQFKSNGFSLGVESVVGVAREILEELEIECSYGDDPAPWCQLVQLIFLEMPKWRHLWRRCQQSGSWRRYRYVTVAHHVDRFADAVLAHQQRLKNSSSDSIFFVDAIELNTKGRVGRRDSGGGEDGGKMSGKALEMPEMCRISALCCVRSSGQTLFPRLFLHYKQTGISKSQFLRWLQIFISDSKPSAEKPCVLVVDGRRTFLHSPKVLKLCSRSHVSLLPLPRLSAANPLQLHIERKVKERFTYLLSTQSLGHLEPSRIEELFGLAFRETATGGVVLRSFELCGLRPLDRARLSNGTAIKAQVFADGRVEGSLHRGVDGLQGRRGNMAVLEAAHQRRTASEGVGEGGGPSVLDPPVVDPPVVDPPVLGLPVLGLPVLDPSVLDPPVLDPLVLDPPVLDPSVLDPSVLDPPVLAPPVLAPPIVDHVTPHSPFTAHPQSSPALSPTDPSPSPLEMDTTPGVGEASPEPQVPNPNKTSNLTTKFALPSRPADEVAPSEKQPKICIKYFTNKTPTVQVFGRPSPCQSVLLRQCSSAGAEGAPAPERSVPKMTLSLSISTLDKAGNARAPSGRQIRFVRVPATKGLAEKDTTLVVNANVKCNQPSPPPLLLLSRVSCDGAGLKSGTEVPFFGKSSTFSRGVLSTGHTQQPVPARVQKPSPKVVQKPSPKVVQKPSPKVVQKPSPKVVQKPSPKVVQKLCPKVVQKLCPIVVQKLCPIVVQKPFPMVVQKPFPMVVQKPFPMVVQKPFPMAVQKPFPMVVQKPFPMVVQKPSPMVVRKPSPMIFQKPSPMVVQKPSPMIFQKPSPLVVRKPSPVMIVKPFIMTTTAAAPPAGAQSTAVHSTSSGCLSRPSITWSGGPRSLPPGHPSAGLVLGTQGCRPPPKTCPSTSPSGPVGAVTPVQPSPSSGSSSARRLLILKTLPRGGAPPRPVGVGLHVGDDGLEITPESSSSAFRGPSREDRMPNAASEKIESPDVENDDCSAGKRVVPSSLTSSACGSNSSCSFGLEPSIPSIIRRPVVDTVAPSCSSSSLFSVSRVSSVPSVPGTSILDVPSSAAVTSSPCAVLPRFSSAQVSRSSSAEVSRCSSAEVSRCSSAEVSRCSSAEVPRCSSAEVSRCSSAEVSRCSSAEVSRCSSAEVSRCSSAEVSRSSSAASARLPGARVPSALVPRFRSSDVDRPPAKSPSCSGKVLESGTEELKTAPPQETTECAVCGDTTEEPWIQCMGCGGWVHEMCADLKHLLVYYCDFCEMEEDSKTTRSRRRSARKSGAEVSKVASRWKVSGVEFGVSSEGTEENASLSWEQADEVDDGCHDEDDDVSTLGVASTQASSREDRSGGTRRISDPHVGGVEDVVLTSPGKHAALCEGDDDEVLCDFGFIVCSKSIDISEYESLVDPEPSRVGGVCTPAAADRRGS